MAMPLREAIFMKYICRKAHIYIAGLAKRLGLSKELAQGSLLSCL
jgi:hypothetical protein